MRSWFIGVAATLVLMVGCGAVEHEPDLAAAVDGTEAKQTWRFELRGTQGEGSEEVQISCAGAAENARTRLEIACDHEDGEFAVRVVDGVVFSKEGPVPGAKWTRSRDEDPGSVDELSPHMLLSILREATLESKHLGEESVRGVPTARYRLTVDCKKAELTECDAETSSVEVWIAADDTVRRIRVDTPGYSATMEFFDFGADLHIQPPPADEVEKLPGAVDSPPSCGEAGTPISAIRAIDALRRAGFSINREIECDADPAAAFDNVGFPDVFGREGFVSCHVYDGPRSSATETVVRRDVDSGDAELVLANLECMIFTDRPDPEERIERLEQAFAELEREIRR